MNKENIFPRWVRITDYGQDRIRQVDCDGAEFSFLCQVIDYRESYRRYNRYQDWRTRSIRALLWIVEKLMN